MISKSSLETALEEAKSGNFEGLDDIMKEYDYTYGEIFVPELVKVPFYRQNGDPSSRAIFPKGIGSFGSGTYFYDLTNDRFTILKDFLINTQQGNILYESIAYGIKVGIKMGLASVVVTGILTGEPGISFGSGLAFGSFASILIGKLNYMVKLDQLKMLKDSKDDSQDNFDLNLFYKILDKEI